MSAAKSVEPSEACPNILGIGLRLGLGLGFSLGQGWG